MPPVQDATAFPTVAQHAVANVTGPRFVSSAAHCFGELRLALTASSDLRIPPELPRVYSLSPPAWQVDFVPLRAAPRHCGWLDATRSTGWFQISGNRIVCSVRNSPSAIRTAFRTALGIAAWSAGGLLLHSVGLRSTKQAILGLAPSEGGKSTLASLSTPELDCLSDETIFWSGASRTIHATPFFSSTSAPLVDTFGALTAVLFLEKASTLELTRIHPTSALRALAQQVYRPPPEIASSADLLRRMVSLCHSVPSFRFGFPLQPLGNALLQALESK